MEKRLVPKESRKGTVPQRRLAQMPSTIRGKKQGKLLTNVTEKVIPHRQELNWVRPFSGLGGAKAKHEYRRSAPGINDTCLTPSSSVGKAGLGKGLPGHPIPRLSTKTPRGSEVHQERIPKLRAVFPIP